MSMIISFGKCNHYYKYLLLSTLFLFLNYMAFGINYNDSFVEIKLFPGDKNGTDSCDNTVYSPDQRQPYFSKHKYIHFIFCYFFTFLFAMVYYFIEIYKAQRDSIVSKKSEDTQTKLNSSIKLIHKDIGTLYLSANSFLNLFIYYFFMGYYGIFYGFLYSYVKRS